jgi:hypothetical protein
MTRRPAFFAFWIDWLVAGRTDDDVHAAVLQIQRVGVALEIHSQ